MSHKDLWIEYEWNDMTSIRKIIKSINFVR